MPRSWPLCSDIIRFKSRSNSESVSSASCTSVEHQSYVESSRVSESLLLMKFYSLSSDTVHHLLSGKELNLPFEVTDEEREIINFPRSSFVVGRSGTGKTTILTMKLYQKHQLHCIALQDSVQVDVEPQPILHQLFVTVSPKLCHAVKKNVAQWKR